MATCEQTISVNMDAVTAFANRVEAMAAFFDAAPDDDPAKSEMANFGEIEVEKHFSFAFKKVDGELVAAVSVDPELQRIMDMVPA
jgi:hypothetical protein